MMYFRTVTLRKSVSYISNIIHLIYLFVYLSQNFAQQTTTAELIIIASDMCCIVQAAVSFLSNINYFHCEYNKKY